VTFKQRVAAYFPLALSASLMFFAILFLSFNYDHDPLVGGLMGVFGVLTIVGIAFSPNTEKHEP
jgi:hypothetical protein